MAASSQFESLHALSVLATLIRDNKTVNATGFTIWSLGTNTLDKELTSHPIPAQNTKDISCGGIKVPTVFATRLPANPAGAKVLIVNAALRISPLGFKQIAAQSFEVVAFVTPAADFKGCTDVYFVECARPPKLDKSTVHEPRRFPARDPADFRRGAADEPRRGPVDEPRRHNAQDARPRRADKAPHNNFRTRPQDQVVSAPEPLTKQAQPEPAPQVVAYAEKAPAVLEQPAPEPQQDQ